MRILMLLEQFFPPDIRVEKEARTLLSAGHELYLLCPNRDGGLCRETVAGVHVLRVDKINGGMARRWDSYRYTLFFESPFWRGQMARVIEEEGIQALHIHDLPMVKTGLSVARQRGIPLVADLHENYPAAIQARAGWRNWRGRLVMRNRVRRWRRLEKLCVDRADRVLTVVEEAKEHYVRDCAVPLSKVTVVMNTEDPDEFRALPVDDQIVNRYAGYFTLSYVGKLALHRGVQTAISAMPMIVRQIPNAHLLLVGAGSNEGMLRQLAKDEGVGECVEFAGHQPFERVPSYIAASRVCIVPYISSPQTEASCPHKLFQYMAMGKPVIVSSMESLSRLVLGPGAGLVYRAGEPAALADQVIRLFKDKQLAAAMGQRGEEAANGVYNWSRQARSLIEVYESLRTS